MATLNEQLEAEATQLAPEDVLLRLPMSVLLGEAVDVCGFCRKYWKAERSVTGEVLQPGLELAGEAGPLSPTIVDQISALERLTYDAHRRYMIAVGPNNAADSRANFVLSELIQSLEFAFDDDVEDEWDARMAKLHEQHDDNVDNQDGLALALEDYAAVAELAQDRLKEIPSFDLRLIQEARTLAASVRERSAPRDNPDASRALDARNRFATLLTRRIQRVRKAARYVFRHKPEIARLSTSTYERRKRNASRRRAAAKAEAGAA